MEANTYDVINDIEGRHWWHVVRRGILSKISSKYINSHGGGYWI